MEVFREFTMAPGIHKSRFFIRATGHFFIRKPEPEKNAHFGEIFWCRSGSALFYTRNGEGIQLKKGHVWYYPPGSHHKVIPERNGFDYRWLSVEGPDAGALFHSLGILPGINHAGKCPDELFARVVLNLHDPDMLHQLQALAAGFEILTRVVAPAAEDSSLAERAKELIQSSYHQKELNVEKIAALLHVHRVSLTRIFTESLGVTPGRYLHLTRLHAAMKHLSETDLPVKEIAEKCGFSAAGYFIKAFRAQTGQSPGDFHRIYRKQPK